MAAIKLRQSIQYSEKTMLRAERAMRCAPFRLRLFATMIQHSVGLGEIAHITGVQSQYTVNPLSELRVESEMLWLIQVGLLRREVDGQGLTDSFRVAPLGRILVDRWQQQAGVKRYSPTISDRLYNAVLRWFRLPI